MSTVKIKQQPQLGIATIPLTASKSESNRALLINKLAGNISKLHNLSTARDTQIMSSLLQSEDTVLNARDAGTVMRFMTAYLSLKGNNQVITGTDRMCQRPIGILVEALNEIGCNIKYDGKTGYPPLLINKLSNQRSHEIEIAGNVSSQYISALMMIAPSLPKGLSISIKGTIYSLPYINMTLGLMKHFGIDYTFKNQTISIKNQPYSANDYAIESDWSGASYWYSFVALSESAEINLQGLRKNSFQGDQAIVEIMEVLGVSSHFKNGSVTLIKKDHQSSLKYDFKNCPDLAQTVMVIAAAKKINMEMTGLESLKIKETDRTAAMAKELSKIGALLEETEKGTWQLSFQETFASHEAIEFDTYDDHRMAMALAPLSMIYGITIKNPDVVNKSYPEFWDHLKLVGLSLRFN